MVAFHGFHSLVLSDSQSVHVHLTVLIIYSNLKVLLGSQSLWKGEEVQKFQKKIAIMIKRIYVHVVHIIV